MKILLILFVVALTPWQAPAAELKLVLRHGQPVEDRKAAWDGHIDFASWIDDEHIVFASHSGNVACMSLNNGKVNWTRTNVGDITDWSVSQSTNRLAYLTEKNSIYIIDCTNGAPLFTVGSARLAQLLRIDFAIPCRVAITPNDGRLIVCTYSTFYGCNGYVLDSSYKTLLYSFHIDASPKEITVAPKGDRVAIVANEDVLCLRNLATDRDAFFRGERIAKEPDSLTFTIDAPFFSHLRDGGGDTIVYSLDNSWATGKVFVHDIKTKQVKSFDALNGHIELDVSFPTRRIALTGTSTDLTLLDFEGRLLAHKKKATMQRHSCVEFSPNGEQLLVGSWDNTLCVFTIAE